MSLKHIKLGNITTAKPKKPENAARGGGDKKRKRQLKINKTIILLFYSVRQVIFSSSQTFLTGI